MGWNNEYYGSDEQSMWEGPGCPVCGNGPKYLGQLGNRHHWSCRACGMEYSTIDHESLEEKTK